MNLIDVHCHLDGDCYGDLEGLINSVLASDVKKLIVAGVDLNTGRFNKSLSEKYACCYYTVGFHPTELKTYREGDLEKIAALANCGKCVAIGEIGLDYHYPDTDKPLQRRIFTGQLTLAHSLGLPVVIHSRDCAEDMLSIIREYKEYLTCGALMHCYSHSPEIAAELEKYGFYFSFGGTSTYSGSKRARKSIAAISSERLLTETDSPYLPPLSKKGVFPNTPASIPEITANMAEIKGVPAEQFADIVWHNAHALFTKL